MFSVTLLLVVIASCVSAAPNFNVVRLTYNKTDEIPAISPFIVGGKDTDITQYPFVVALLVNLGSVGTALCGGTIIHQEWIVTAAHCFFDESKLAVVSVTVRVGSIYYHSGGYTHYATEVYLFGYDGLVNDIALLRVTPLLDLSKSNVGLILLPPMGFIPPPGATITLLGYGTTSQGGQLARQLQSVNVTAVDQNKCRQTYGNLPDSIFCAGVDEGGKDSCQGDSGGPAIYSSPDKGLITVGIVSFGDGCAKPGIPGAYTNVGSYSDVLNYIIQNL